MKNFIVAVALLIGGTAIGQKAEIFEENGKFGVKTDFGKELIPADYTHIREVKTDTLDFFIVLTEGTGELFSYNLTKRSVYDESTNEVFSEVIAIYEDAVKGKVFYGFDKLGNKYKFVGHAWDIVKTKGAFIGGKNQEGKYAVCQKGQALTDYIYEGVNMDHDGVIQVKLADGWQALDAKLKPIHEETYDHLWTSETHENVYIIRKGDKWGIFSSDGSMEMPLIDLRNPEKIFALEDESLGNLERGFAHVQGGKYGISDNEGKEVLPFVYDDVYAFDPKETGRNGLEIVAVAKEGSNWKFFNAKYKEVKSVIFDEWIALVGYEALVLKDGKMKALNLKTYEFERAPYFNDWEHNMNVEADNGHEGLVSPQGDIILGFDNDQVHIAYEGENPFVIVEKNGKDGIHNIDGTMLVSHDYETLYELCHNEKHYFAMGKLHEKLALAYWDEATNKIISVTKAIYTSINCYGKTDDGFSATNADGDVVNLKGDGTIVE